MFDVCSWPIHGDQDELRKIEDNGHTFMGIGQLQTSNTGAILYDPDSADDIDDDDPDEDLDI